MIVKNAWYAKSLPRHSVVEMEDGRFYAFRDSPFRVLTEKDLTPLQSSVRCMKKDEIPDHTLKFYGLERSQKVSVLLTDGSRREIEYKALCHELEIDPSVHFVVVEKSGKITFSCGHREECVFLLNAVERCGYVAAKGLRSAVHDRS